MKFLLLVSALSCALAALTREPRCRAKVGPVGPQGPVGPKGSSGQQGLTGPQGPVGPRGSSGSQGLTGPQGPAGLNGSSGQQGPTGPQGLTGTQGPVGPQGVKGDQGVKGESCDTSRFTQTFDSMIQIIERQGKTLAELNRKIDQLVNSTHQCNTAAGYIQCGDCACVDADNGRSVCDCRWKRSPEPDCMAHLNRKSVVSGLYRIVVNGKELTAFCDMETSGGGWTTLQRRQDGSIDFFRGWADYESGFGDVRGEFWFGLENIHQLTTATQNEVRIDMTDGNNVKKWAEYTSFHVAGAGDKYRLKLGAYQGNAGDNLSYHNGQPFSTFDRDNEARSNCARDFKGGFWYAACHQVNINGIYHPSGTNQAYAIGIHWYKFTGHYKSLLYVDLKVRTKK